MTIHACAGGGGWGREGEAHIAFVSLCPYKYTLVLLTYTHHKIQHQFIPQSQGFKNENRTQVSPSVLKSINIVKAIPVWWKSLSEITFLLCIPLWKRRKIEFETSLQIKICSISHSLSAYLEFDIAMTTAFLQLERFPARVFVQLFTE